MRARSWKSFLAAAYPPEMAMAEATKDLLFRGHRWVGVRLAYPIYRLGVSANALSTIRLLTSLTGMCLLATAKTGKVWLPFAGVALLYSQMLLDFSDGAIARVQEKKSALGEPFDAIANAAASVALLVLLGVYTGSAVLVVVAVGSAYVLTTFRLAAEAALPHTGGYRAFRHASRFLVSVKFLVLILPLALVVLGSVGEGVVRASYILVFAYAAIALAWVVISVTR